eukprot:gene10426-21752_t
MVKGNWERRAELAALRRSEEKLKIAQKKNVLHLTEEGIHSTITNISSITSGVVGIVNERAHRKISPEVVFSKLITTGHTSREDIIMLCWTSSDVSISEVPVKDGHNVGRFVCKAWYRSDVCTNRKCKLKHEGYPMSEFKGVIYFEDDPDPKEQLCYGPFPIHLITTKTAKFIKFIALDNTIIYDYAHPCVWSSWYDSQCLRLGMLNDQFPLSTIEEHADDSIENFIKSEELIQSMKISIPSFTLDNWLKFNINDHLLKCIASICQYVHNIDFLSLISSSKYIRNVMLKEESIFIRRKELQSMISHTVAKMKKIDKKKRIKHANLKRTDKKDGFARGGNDGGR